MSDTKHHCSFCGKSQDDVLRLVQGQPGTCICNECIDLCSQLVKDEEKAGFLQGMTSPEKLPKPKEITSHLKQYVIGQEKPQKQLAVALYNHYKRLYGSNKNQDIEGYLIYTDNYGNWETYISDNFKERLIN